MRWHLYAAGRRVRCTDGPLEAELPASDWHSAAAVTGERYRAEQLEPESAGAAGQPVALWRDRVILSSKPLVGWHTTPKGVRAALRARRRAFRIIAGREEKALG